MGEEPLERNIIATEVLAASLAIRLTLEELEWLWRDLAKRAEEKRREAAGGKIRTIPSMRTTSETISFLGTEVNKQKGRGGVSGGVRGGING